MNTDQITDITSRDNKLVKDIRKLVDDNNAYRKLGKVWIEGDHLCRAYLARGGVPLSIVFAAPYQSTLHSWIGDCPASAYRLPLVLMQELSSLESASGVGFLIAAPDAFAKDAGVRSGVPTVILDRVQDAGNVGSILRCASAFGYAQVLAMKGSAALWSNKVLRAAMGAHFNLHLVEGVLLEDLDQLKVPLLMTSSHQGDYLHEATLPTPSAWVFGHEGQGVSPELEQRASQWIRIRQPGGEESLNVAAAAAICLHAI